jgi:hypothetical protein
VRSFIEALAHRGLVRADWLPYGLEALGLANANDCPASPPPPRADVAASASASASGLSRSRGPNPTDNPGDWPPYRRDALCELLVGAEAVARAGRSVGDAAAWAASIEPDWVMDAFWAAAMAPRLVDALGAVTRALEAVPAPDKGQGQGVCLCVPGQVQPARGK